MAMSTVRTLIDGNPAHMNQARLKRGDAPVTLASASPRRAELLTLTGWAFVTSSADIDESPLPGEPPEALVCRLAIAKAVRAAESTNGPLVIAADTEVVLEGRILGKPSDRKHAAEMLASLRGREHRVITAIAVLERSSGRTLTDICETPVRMRPYGQAEVSAYVESDAPLDKAGGYGIQDDHFNPVDMNAMNECYANVMGLPLCHLMRTLRRLGREPSVDIPRACRQHTRYSCSVFPRILQGSG
ncbi:MAG TPA: Maf family protein [Anaerolineales bacterium]|nr:Maf family protein [Anaerolineales bacterium]